MWLLFSALRPYGQEPSLRGPRVLVAADTGSQAQNTQPGRSDGYLSGWMGEETNEGALITFPVHSPKLMN